MSVEADAWEDHTSKQVGGNHYERMQIDPLEYIMANELDWCEGNIIKYVSRYKHKNGIEDLKKARHYLELLIKNYGGR